MRTAIDMVVSSLGPHFSRRAKVVSAIVPQFGIEGLSAATLANLALEKMGFPHRISDGEESPTET
jgi:hypothetical protein